MYIKKTVAGTGWFSTHKMKCENCGKEFVKNTHNHRFCSTKCMDKASYMRNREAEIKRSLDYYYKNRTEVLKKQSKRWSMKYKNDEGFRNKRKLRDKTIRRFSLKEKKCSKCGSKKDLHRHHPNIKKYLEFIILCRKCHNALHFG